MGSNWYKDMLNMQPLGKLHGELEEKDKLHCPKCNGTEFTALHPMGDDFRCLNPACQTRFGFNNHIIEEDW